MKKLFDILEELEAIGTKRNPKIELLQKHKDLFPLREIFKQTYNWLTSYGVKKYKLPEPGNIFDSYKDPGWANSRANWIHFHILLKCLAHRIFTGNKALSQVNCFLRGCNPTEIKWYDRVLQRDLRVGCSVKTIQKVWQNMLPVWGVQLGETLAPKHKLEFPLYVDPKLDGFRFIFVVKDGKSRAFSRSKIEYPQFKHIHAALPQIKDNVVFDGEIFKDNHKRTKELMPMRKKKGYTQADVDKAAKLDFHIFDCVPVDSFFEGECRTPLKLRREGLFETFKQAKQVPDFLKLIKHVEINSEEEIDEVYQRFLDEGYEGAMLKSPAGWYQLKRTDDWLKHKPDITMEVLILELIEGSGKHKGKLGAFKVQLPNGDTAQCGTGLSDKQREDFWKIGDKLVDTVCELLVQKDATSVAKLRFPVFVKLRPDRKWNDPDWDDSIEDLSEKLSA